MEYKEENLLSQDGYGGGSSNSKTPFLDRSRVRILLCDNDVKSSEEVFTLLCNCSYQVTSVRTARQVIDALNAEGPDIDIILTEVDIPIAKGLKLLKYIMRDQELRRIPIIMMSAQDEVSVVVKCLRLGAADYLVKPLRTNELLNLWTHMWRRRHMLGLTEKNIMNFDFDLVGSDPSDANTNSTTLFSDDTDDKSRRSALPEMSVSNHQENESNANASVEPPWKNLLEYHPDVPAISDRRTGQISSFPKKSELKVGESSAFFTYVKSSLPTNNSQKVGYLDENAAPHLESSSREKIIPAWCKQVADDAEGRENSGVLQSYSRGYGFPSSDNAPGSTSVERSCTPLVPLEFQNGRNLKEEQLSTVVVHPSNQSQPDVSGVPSLTPLPYYSSGMMNQIMMPSSAQLYQRNLHDFPQYTTSAMLPQYNHLSQCPRLPMMTSFPYYPFNIYMQPGQMPATHMWPSIGSSSSPEVKTGQVERREAALIKFRQKRKDRCFDKKIRYVKRKRLAEKRPRVRGQFVRQVNGVDVDLSVQPSAVDDSDEDEEDGEDEEELASRDSSPENDASGFQC